MIILASQSQTRRRLLADAGLAFDTQSPPVDEVRLKLQYQHLPPARIAQQLADAKALSITTAEQATLVIGSDQILAFHGELLTKATSMQVAKSQLLRLRHQTHTLHSAVTVARAGQIIFQTHDSATLTMRNFSEAWLDHYLTTAGDTILQCVGCYQIEGLGLNLFSKIAGNSFTIQGLPLLPLLAFLRDIGEIPT